MGPCLVGIKLDASVADNVEGFPWILWHCLGWCHIMTPVTESARSIGFKKKSGWECCFLDTKPWWHWCLGRSEIHLIIYMFFLCLGMIQLWRVSVTLPETNSSPLKIGPSQKGNFQPSIFREGRVKGTSTGIYHKIPEWWFGKSVEADVVI